MKYHIADPEINPSTTWIASATGLYRSHPEYARLVRQGIAASGGAVRRPRLTLAEGAGA